MKLLCKVLGHKWIPVYIRKGDRWSFIGTYCRRCWFGRAELYDFLEFNSPMINTYNAELWKEGGE